MPDEMFVDPRTFYGAPYWTGKSTYRDAYGQVHRYHGPSTEWQGFDLIADALCKILPPSVPDEP